MPYNGLMSTVAVSETEQEAIVRYDVKAARLASGLKQYELAEKLGITPTYLSDLERHVYVPSPELFAKICLYVGKPPGDYVYLDMPD